jgi:hypothetical protein
LFLARGITAFLDKAVGVDHGVLGAADLTDDRARCQLLLGDIELFKDAAQKRAAIAFVVDAEIGIHAKSFGFVAQ